MDTQLQEVPTNTRHSPAPAGARRHNPGPEGPDLVPDRRVRLAIVVVVCVVLALVSAFPLADHFGNPATYAGQISSLNAKASTVSALVASSTTASVLVTVAPGDIGTPIAEKLVDLSTDFAVVLAAIYLEKYLLTILGMASFRVLIPLGLGAVALTAACAPDSRWRHTWSKLSFKLLVFSLAALLVVPTSIWVSDTIQATYQEEIDAAVSAAGVVEDASQQVQQETSSSTGNAAGSTSTNTTTTSSGSGTSSGGSLLDDIAGWLTGAGSAVTSAATEAVDAVGEGTTELLNSAKNALNSLVEALVVMIVTNCVVPVLVLVFFVWLARVILGVDVDVSAGMDALRSRAHHSRAALGRAAKSHRG